jgi:hypothetical protein
LTQSFFCNAIDRLWPDSAAGTFLWDVAIWGEAAAVGTGRQGRPLTDAVEKVVVHR